jgi:CRISPR locus-related DNA-binding protein
LGRLFAFTLGYTENFALRRLNRARAGPYDYVAVFTVEPVAEGVKDAYENLKALAKKMGVVDVYMIELPQGNMGEALAKALSALRSFVKAGYEPVIFDITGGSRYIVAVILLAALALRGVKREVWVSSDTGGGWEAVIPYSVLEALTGDMRREHIEILKALSSWETGMTVGELSERLGLSEKTVRNRVSELKRMGFCVQRGRGGAIKITEWGVAMLLSLGITQRDR